MSQDGPAFQEQLPPSFTVILIGGTSHVGKSTLARYLADGLGWDCRATDKLAKHPGRPWRNDGGDVPAHVSEHYAILSKDELVDDVLRHYEKNVMPQVNAMVAARAADPSPGGLVLEGSALWPAFVAPLVSDRVGAVWLLGSSELLAERIRAESRYAQKPADDRLLIDAFLDRTIEFAMRLTKVLGDQALPAVELRDAEPIQTLARRCLRAIAAGPGGAAAV